MKKSSSILLFVVTWFYITSHVDAQWIRVQGSIPFNVAVRAFVSYPNGTGGRNLLAGTEGAGVFLSTNDGASWTATNSGLNDYEVYSLAVSDTIIFAGTYGSGVFRSSINIINWSEANTGMTGFEIYSFAVSGSNIYAGAFFGGVFRSTNNGNTWNSIGLYYVLSLHSFGEYLFAGTAAGQVWHSSDNGSNWLPSNSGLLYTTYNTLATSPSGSNSTNLFAGAYWDSSGVFLSTDYGMNWNQFNEGLTNLNVWTIAVSGVNIFAGTGDINGGGVCLSTNGSDWIAIDEGFPFAFPVVSLYISGDYIFAGTLNGVWRRPLSDFVPVELTSFSATVYDDNVELSWITATETNNQGFEIERSQISNIKSQTDWEKIGFVEGHGTTTETQAYSFIDKNVVIGNYKYRLKQLDYDGTFEYSNVVEVEVTFPSTFSLEQNFPNPFNPSTTIPYSIPNVIASETKQSQYVTLKVYDILSNEIATLVSEEKQAGSYEVIFNASQLSTGIYLYKLQADSFVETKKMILMK